MIANIIEFLLISNFYLPKVTTTVAAVGMCCSKMHLV